MLLEGWWKIETSHVSLHCSVQTIHYWIELNKYHSMLVHYCWKLKVNAGVTARASIHELQPTSLYTQM